MGTADREKIFFELFLLAFAAYFFLASAGFVFGQIFITGFVTADESSQVSGLAVGGGGSSSSPEFNLDASFGSASAGEASSSDYTLQVGPQYFLNQDLDPQFFNQSQSSSTPKLGESVILSVAFVDDNSLDTAKVFVDAGSGFKEELNPIQMSGQRFEAKYTWIKDLPKDTKVSWKMQGFDSAGNSVETDVLSFVVGAIDTESPKISEVGIDPTIPVAGQLVDFSASVSDNFGLGSAALEINGKEATRQVIKGLSDKVSLLYDARDIAPGTLIKWKIKVSDGAGNEVATEEKTFELSAPQILKVVCPESAKPKATESSCVNGKKNVTEPSCNSQTALWETKTRTVDCLKLGIENRTISLPSFDIEKKDYWIWIVGGILLFIGGVGTALFAIAKKRGITIQEYLNEVILFAREKLKMAPKEVEEGKTEQRKKKKAAAG